MKQNIMLVFLLFNFLIVYNQGFAPVGAKWYYSQGDINPNYQTYITLESITDTLFHGYEAKKIEKISRNFLGPKISYIYMFDRNDSVFFYDDEVDRYCLLYDFSAEQGDTIVLDCFYAHYSDSEESSLLVIVDSVKTMLIDGQNRKVQYVNAGDGFNIEFGNKFIEGIGSIDYMFPTNDHTLDGPLRCYVYDDFIYKNTSWIGECDQTNTTVTDTYYPDIQIVPNPIRDYIQVKNNQGFYSYSLYSINGRLIFDGILTENQEIDITGIRRGIYFLTLSNKTARKTFKVIKE